MEEKSYFQRYVELLRKSRSPEHYFNHFPWQARIVIENILQYALDNHCDHVRVFTGSFTEFYGKNIVDMLGKVARSGANIEIIFADHPTTKDLGNLNFPRDINNISVRYMQSYDPNLNHLWLAGNAYRFELPHPKFRTTISDTSPECPAQFAFHNEEQARKVSKYWEETVCSRELFDLNAA